MLITDVERMTGLSRSMVRFYEESGLLSAACKSGMPREYDDTAITELRTTAVLRCAGISFTDIRLWRETLISAEEMLRKRLSVLAQAPDQTGEQVQLCRELLQCTQGGGLCMPAALWERCDLHAVDDGKVLFASDQPCCVGIDIGTTTVCAYVLRLSDGVPVGIYTVRNASDLPSLFVGDKRQDAEVLYDRVRRLTDAILRFYPAVRAIGFTGQMHGMLCTDARGNALTPLYTWQDQRAIIGCTPAAAEIIRLTGCHAAAGYGLATFYALLRDETVPADTARICTVMDYAAARLCGVHVSVMHTTNAASLGLFDSGKGMFDTEALSALGISPKLLPRVTDVPEIIGTYRDIPVAVPIGDNQASFLGAVQDPSVTALANFGTGSQISLLAADAAVASGGDVELRPFAEGKYLISGSALCGGRAYAMLERFFRDFAAAAGYEDRELYPILNRLAADAVDAEASLGRLQVKTTFCGTREVPNETGAVFGINEERFTPGALAAGILRGMAEELYAMYETMPHKQIRQLVVSGNAVRRNPVLRRILSEIFSMPVHMPAEQEEAAFGAAMIAAVGAGYAENTSALSGWIRYSL